MATGCDKIGGTRALVFYLLYLHLLYLAKMPYLGGICPDVDTPLQGLVESRGYSIHGSFTHGQFMSLAKRGITDSLD